MTNPSSESKSEQRNFELDILMSRFVTDIRRGSIQLIVLKLLNSKPQHGYGLIKSIKDLGIEIKAGTVYPLLKRLNDNGVTESIENPNTREYMLTEKGRNLLNQMIREWYLLIEVIEKV